MRMTSIWLRILCRHSNTRSQYSCYSRTSHLSRIQFSRTSDWMYLIINYKHLRSDRMMRNRQIPHADECANNSYLALLCMQNNTLPTFALKSQANVNELNPATAKLAILSTERLFICCILGHFCIQESNQRSVIGQRFIYRWSMKWTNGSL